MQTVSFLDVTTVVATVLSAAAAVYAALAHRRVADLKVTVDGRMGELLVATQALGREQGRAAEVLGHMEEANGHA